MIYSELRHQKIKSMTKQEYWKYLCFHGHIFESREVWTKAKCQCGDGVADFYVEKPKK